MTYLTLFAASQWVALPVAGLVLVLIQFLAAIPWLTVVLGADRKSIRSFLPQAAGILAGGGLLVAIAFFFMKDKDVLGNLGRWYGIALQLQLILDFFVLVFWLLLLIWPRGGAVALAAFREWLRHPLFWFISVGAMFLILVSPIIPYFTLGEDMKMVQELGYDTIMMASVLFGVIAAAMSISEEIEGRTAITLMSKPVSRRQFLLGKFAGIFLVSLLMTGVLSVVFGFVIWYKNLHPEDVNFVFDAPPVASKFAAKLSFWGDGPSNLSRGVVWWLSDAWEMIPGLVLGLSEVMMLVAVAVALATRLPMILNLVFCSVVFFLSQLTPMLGQVSQRRFPLIQFMANLFDSLLPALKFLKYDNVISLPVPPSPREFAWYVATATLLSIVYTGIALLFGLIMFEDRDLA
jgi:ABC-type transport system involved in multi-copper enzyme maturation permease subunit